MKGIRWVYLDAGWTLVDETKSHLDRLGKALAFAGRKRGLSTRSVFDAYKAALHLFSRDAFVEVLGMLGIPAAERPRFPFDHSFEVLFPDAVPALERLAARVKLGVLANQSPGLAERLKSYGLDRYFAVILGSADVGMKKPEDRFFALAREKAGCAPHEILMVGDRGDYDIAPAKAAGWRTARLLRGPHGKQAPRSEGERADFEVKSLLELAAVLEGAGAPGPEVRRGKGVLPINERGEVTAWPTKVGEKKAVLVHLASFFEGGRDYTERQVNAVIAARHTFGDICMLRRELISRRLLAREDDGRRYWKPES